MKGKLIFGSFIAILFFLGAFWGDWLKPRGNAVIRVGQRQSEMDYDFFSALEVLKYQLEKAGIKVSGVSYSGDLYPLEFNDASINIFARGFRPFFDLRMNRNAVNVMYVHRTPSFYLEEMRNFDAYLTSQKSVYLGQKRLRLIGFFKGGAVPHERLVPNYREDVLYIYEEADRNWFNVLNSRYKVKAYTGIEFMALSKEERKEALAFAKVVMYDMVSSLSPLVDSDAHYVPYAVYDIISYGRPVATNYRHDLEKMFSDDVVLLEDDVDKRLEKLQQFLALDDDVREKKAQHARTILLKRGEDEALGLHEWIKKMLKKVEK